MKKNLVPLLGIAFVVATATTGIFYGLFVGKLGAAAPTPVVVALKDLKPGSTLSPEMVKVIGWTGSPVPSGSFTTSDQVAGRRLIQPISEGEPILPVRLERPAITAGGAIEPSQRAVSTHVTDSLGVLEMLRPGDHVDVQVLSIKDRDPEIRTILQNRTVLAIHMNPEATTHGDAAAPVVTLLVDKNESEALALADSTARVRLALRNPEDHERNSHAGLAFSNLLHNGSPRPDVAAEPAPVKPPEKPVASAASTAASAPGPDIQLQVQVLSAAPGALEELFRPAESGGGINVFQASAVKRPADLAASLKSLEQQKSVEVVSTSQVRTGLSTSVSLQAGKQDPHAGVRIRFSPLHASDGRLHLLVEPEVTTPGSVRKLDTKIDVASGQAFLLGGLVQAKERAAVLDKLFGGRELVVIVTPRLANSKP